MIEKLTKEQESLIPIVTKRWTDFYKAGIVDSEKAIRQIYVVNMASNYYRMENDLKCYKEQYSSNIKLIDKKNRSIAGLKGLIN